MEEVVSTAMVTNPVYIFFIVLVIILLAPMCLNRLKIPHIIGMIVAGLVIGPYGIHILDRDSSFEIFGQVGLLYLMFLAGLEIDMFHMKQNLKRGLGFGAYTFIIPMGLGILASMWLLNFDLLTSVLLASMYASHTLISYPIVSRFSINKYSTVVVSITGSIVAEFAALIVLAVVVGIYAEGSLNIGGVIQLFVSLVAYCVAILFVYPRLARWFFKKYNDSVMQYVFVLALVFLASSVAHMIGLEAVLGAFFAGLVLSRYIPSVSPLMNRIEFVGNALFIPYFLIGVGMLIDLKSVVSSWDTLYVAVNMVVVATLCKWIAAYLTQKTFRMNKLDRQLMFGLSNAHAAIALAAVMIGYNLNIFGEAVLNGTVLMILITCAVASIATERAAAKIKMAMVQGELGKEVASKKGFRTLISVANPITVQRLMELSIAMRGSNKNEDLYTLHVRNDNSSASMAIGKNALQLAAQTAASADVPMKIIERYDLNTITGILNSTMERDITCLMLWLHQKNTVVDTFYGSKIEQLINQTNRMIIISRTFIPINAVTRLVVYSPENAEFETGFERWVLKCANMAREIGCRIVFCAHPETQRYITGIITGRGYHIRYEYRDVMEWEDFVLLTPRVKDDDLVVMINARRASISFNPELDNIPNFVLKYFAKNNILVVFPEQFGEESQLTSFIDPLATTHVKPMGVWVRMRAWYNVTRKGANHILDKKDKNSTPKQQL